MRVLRTRAILTVVMLCLTHSLAVAQSRETIGIGRIFNNDALGDGRDRWQSGSYALSVIRSRTPYDPEGQPFGALIEYRLRSQVITRERPFDQRPYVGAVSAGIATHFGADNMMFSLGADLMAIGPQTGLATLQERFHDAFGLQSPATDNPLPDDVRLSVDMAVMPTARLNETVSIRPFVAATGGVEEIFRTGADVLVGPVGQRDLWLRDPVSGQLYRATRSAETGLAYSFGGDIARVGDSVFLPDGAGPDAAGQRRRARAGVHWQPTPETALFYGLAYLSEEFRGQREGQVIGSVSLSFSF